MDAGGAAGGVARFGVFDLDLRTAELRKGGQSVIEDLGSRNGTLVKGRRVEGLATLSDGDEIHLGALHLTFRAPEARASAETV